jgi:hypothetical protein
MAILRVIFDLRANIVKVGLNKKAETIDLNDFLHNQLTKKMIIYLNIKQG